MISLTDELLTRIEVNENDIPKTMKGIFKIVSVTVKEKWGEQVEQNALLTLFLTKFIFPQITTPEMVGVGGITLRFVNEKQNNFSYIFSQSLSRFFFELFKLLSFLTLTSFFLNDFISTLLFI